MEINEVNNNYKEVKSKTVVFKSMKMQDFFKIYDKTNENRKNKVENKEILINENSNSSQIYNNNDLYKFLYESTTENDEEIQNQIKSIKKEEIIKEKSITDNNMVGGIFLIEDVNIYIDDVNRKYTEMIIQNFECKFNFDEKVSREFSSLVHFTPKYFEFPFFYAFKGKFDKDTNVTTITLKDYRSYKLLTKNNLIYKQIFDSIHNIVDFYKYAKFYKYIQDKKNIKYKKNGWNIYDPLMEFQRQGVDFSNKKFCLSFLNNKYELCETYPNILVIPKKFENKDLFNIAKSRMKNRFPVLTYHFKNKKGVKSYLYRSSQINKGGIIFKSKNLEVEYLNYIMNIEKDSKGFIIFDCRPELNAKANSLKGGGVENIAEYKNCIYLIHGNIENIHAVRKALKIALQKAYYGKENLGEGKISIDIKNYNVSNFLTKFESTKWLSYLSDLLLGSIIVAKNMLKSINILVHCSDGWDRTTQICSLVQIILDPYFRTIEGFAVLIEKDWVSFGHKFASRNGCEITKEKIKKKERCPIFIQFLHAVYQISIQYPTAFEFNSYFLLFLCDEIYSNRYGTFLFNNEKDKNKNNAPNTMISIWSDVFYNKNKYTNYLYRPMNGTINVKGEMKYLNIWNDFFFKYDKIGMTYINQSLYDRNDFINKVQEEKNANILELLKVIKDNGLENLIEDNKIYKMFKDDINKNE